MYIRVDKKEAEETKAIHKESFYRSTLSLAQHLFYYVFVEWFFVQERRMDWNALIDSTKARIERQRELLIESAKNERPSERLSKENY